MSDQGKRTSFYDKNGYPLVPIYHELKTANIQSSKSIEDIVRKRVYKDYEDKRLLKKLLKDLITDPNIQEDLIHVGHYVACVIIYGADGVDGDSDFNPKRENLKDATNISMYHNFIQTPLNPEYETLKEAIKVEHYQDNVCWINTLTDCYKNTLMGDKKRDKNKLTRESILKISEVKQKMISQPTVLALTI